MLGLGLYAYSYNIIHLQQTDLQCAHLKDYFFYFFRPVQAVLISF